MTGSVARRLFQLVVQRWSFRVDKSGNCLVADTSLRYDIFVREPGRSGQALDAEFTINQAAAHVWSTSVARCSNRCDSSGGIENVELTMTR